MKWTRALARRKGSRQDEAHQANEAHALTAVDRFDDTALPHAVSAMKEAAQSEETRFANFNTRAVSLLGASSLVTALLGAFVSDAPGGTRLGDARPVVVTAILVSLVALGASAVVVVLGVLLPSRRISFGGNAVTHPPGATAERAVLMSLYVDSWLVWQSLDERNQRKASALQAAYASFSLAVVGIAVGTADVCVRAL